MPFTSTEELRRALVRRSHEDVPPETPEQSSTRDTRPSAQILLAMQKAQGFVNQETGWTQARRLYTAAGATDVCVTTQNLQRSSSSSPNSPPQ